MDQETFLTGVGIVFVFGLAVWVKTWIRNGGVDRLLSKKKP